MGFVAIKALDFITADISEFRTVKGNPEGTALFVGGFMIFLGFVIHGSALSPIFFGQTVAIENFLNVTRLLIILLSTVACVVFGWIFYLVFGKIKLFGIHLDDVNNSPTAVGAFLFCYEVLLGLIVHAALTMPL